MSFGQGISELSHQLLTWVAEDTEGVSSGTVLSPSLNLDAPQNAP